MDLEEAAADELGPRGISAIVVHPGLASRAQQLE